MGIYDSRISYGLLVETKKEVSYVDPIEVKKEDGTISYVAPSGYTLEKDENGKAICKRDTKVFIDNGYGITATYGELTYSDADGFKYEHEYT